MFVVIVIEAHVRVFEDSLRMVVCIRAVEVLFNRITSYNVCYTKLLRVSHYERAVKLAPREAQGQITLGETYTAWITYPEDMNHGTMNDGIWCDTRNNFV